MSNYKEQIVIHVEGVDKEVFANHAQACSEVLMPVFEKYCIDHNINPLPLGMTVFSNLSNAFGEMLIKDAQKRGMIPHTTKTYDA